MIYMLYGTGLVKSHTRKNNKYFFLKKKKKKKELIKVLMSASTMKHTIALVLVC